MKISKSKFTFFLIFLLVLNSKILGGIRINLLPTNMGFSSQILLSGLKLAKKTLVCAISCYHQRSNMALLGLDFEVRHSPENQVGEDEYNKKREKLIKFFDKKQIFLNSLLGPIEQIIRKLNKQRLNRVDDILCSLTMILSKILKDLPGFNLNGHEKVLSRHNFNVICSLENDLIIDFQNCCKIIDLLFFLNKNLLFKQLSISDQMELSKSYNKAFRKNKFFQRGIIII